MEVDSAFVHMTPEAAIVVICQFAKFPPCVARSLSSLSAACLLFYLFVWALFGRVLSFVEDPKLMIKMMRCSMVMRILAGLALLIVTTADAQSIPLNCTGDREGIGGCYVVFASGASTAEECNDIQFNQYVLPSPPLELPSGQLFAGSLFPATVTADGQCCLTWLPPTRGGTGGCSEIETLIDTPSGGCSSAQITAVCSAAEVASSSENTGIMIFTCMSSLAECIMMMIKHGSLMHECTSIHTGLLQVAPVSCRSRQRADIRMLEDSTVTASVHACDLHAD